MSNVGRKERSFLQLSAGDLQQLLDLAVADRSSFFRRYPGWADAYARRTIAIALCQGAALHYCCGDGGINDFDVYTFYAANPKRRWYAKRHAITDFGDAKFGKSSTHPAFVGRRVDLLSRALAVEPRTDAVSAIRAYLREGRTKTARLLAQKAVVLLNPELGRCIWPVRDPA